MNRYSYKAIDQNGKHFSGKISAENVSDLIALLKSNSLELLSYSKERERSIFSGKLKSSDLIGIFIHLEQLERAGVSIIESISDLKETADSQQVKNLMHEIHESIKKGSLFSESLAKRPDIFNQTYIGLIGMGERTGNLTSAFMNIIDDIKWNNDIKRKTKKATTGPLFGIIVMLVVLGVMTTVVVPKVTGFLTGQGIPLPVMTTSLIAFSHFLGNYWYIILLTPVIIWTAIKIAIKSSQRLALRVDGLKIKIPIMGPIVSKIESAKFCQFFAMTFKSGLGIIECLESASGVIKNRAIKSAIDYIKQRVAEGHSLSKSIAETGYFPNLVVRMFKIGEDSGNMESSLNNIKFFYDREINDSIDKLVGMIQPTITLVMGGMIGWIAVAVFGPIYGTFAKM